jgi:hypothetical protein
LNLACKLQRRFIKSFIFYGYIFGPQDYDFDRGDNSVVFEIGDPNFEGNCQRLGFGFLESKVKVTWGRFL